MKFSAYISRSHSHIPTLPHYQYCSLSQTMSHSNDWSNRFLYLTCPYILFSPFFFVLTVSSLLLITFVCKLEGRSHPICWDNETLNYETRCLLFAVMPDLESLYEKLIQMLVGMHLQISTTDWSPPTVNYSPISANSVL